MSPTNCSWSQAANTEIMIILGEKMTWLQFEYYNWLWWDHKDSWSDNWVKSLGCESDGFVSNMEMESMSTLASETSIMATMVIMTELAE